MNTAKRDKIILSVLVIAIICVVMFYVSVKPSMDEIDSLNSKISSARASIDSLKGKSVLINDLKKQLEEIEAEVEIAEGDMANFDDYALYLSDFQDITEKATNTRISFSSTVPSESGYYMVVQAKVEFSCSYADLKEIMTDLFEKNVHCYDVNISDATTAGSTDRILKVNFTADYLSGIGSYESGNYDFTSGKYGLSELFDGVATGGTASGNGSNTDTNTNAEGNSGVNENPENSENPEA